MEMELVLAQVTLAILLFLCINWIGKHSLNSGYVQMSAFVKTNEAPAFNFLYRSFAPVVFITLASAILYALNMDYFVSNIYMTVVYHSALRLAFNILVGRSLLLNWPMQIGYALVSISVAYYVYSNLIIHKSFFFPEPKDIGNALWLGVAAFIYHTCNSVRLSDVNIHKRKNNYLKKSYEKYKYLYGEIISRTAECENQESLIYAVLIYESFNRPKLYRLIENILFFLGFAKTLGVMQVTTDKYIDDFQSVELGSERIINSFRIAQKHPSATHGCWVVRNLILRDYNPDNDYIDEVIMIDEIIKKEFYDHLIFSYDE